MNAQFRSPFITSLLTRVKSVTLNPKGCWNTISLDNPSALTSTITIVAPLAALAIVIPVIGKVVFGVYVEFFGFFRAPLFYALINQSLEISMMIASLFADAWMIQKLAPQFYRSVTFDKAFALVANSAIPGFLGWTLGIIPQLLQLKVLFFVYSLCVLFYGCDKMVAINRNAPKNNTRVEFFAGVLGLLIVIHIILHGLVEPIAPSPFIDLPR